jgi:hypothetical protein
MACGRIRSVGFRTAVILRSRKETTKLIGSRLLIQHTESSARRIVIRAADPIISATVSPDGLRLIYSSGFVKRNIKEYSANGRLVRGVAN